MIWLKIQNGKCRTDVKYMMLLPFDETIVLDADMLVLEDITHWWKALANYELFYTDKVKTFRNELVTDTFYRKVFEANDLSNVYCGMYYSQTHR